MRERRERSRGRRALPILSVTAALIVLLFLWWHAITKVPQIAVPMPKMPSPNAFDDLIAASNAMMDSGKVGWATSTMHVSGQPDDHPYTTAQKAALIAENAETFRLLHKALNETYWAPPVRSFNVLVPYYAHFRALARLIALEQQARAERGDWGGAVECGLDGIQMGEQIPHGANLIGLLVGIACEAIGQYSMWSEIDHIDAAQARTATKRLESILADRFPYTDTLQEEKWSTLAGMQEMFRKANWQKELMTNGFGSQSGTPNPFSWQGLQAFGMELALVLRGGPKVTLYNYAAYMDSLQVRARLRYGTHPALPPVPDDPINQMLGMTFSQADFVATRIQTSDDLLLVALALRAYYVEHGSYPQTLEALAPSYLTEVPQDLFAATGILRYRPQDKKYLLYSVGPDGVDDGGRPALNSNPTASNRYSIQGDSKGDIVAGINK